MEREAGAGVRPGVWEWWWAGQTLPPLLNKQICVQHRPSALLGGDRLEKLPLSKRDEYLVVTILRVLYYPTLTESPRVPTNTKAQLLPGAQPLDFQGLAHYCAG